MASAGGQRPQDMVKLPAMILLGMTPFVVILSMIAFYVMPGVLSSFFQKLQASGNIPSTEKVDVSHTVVDYLLLLLGLAGAGFVMFGAAKMLRMQSWNISLAACIVSMIPFVYAGNCCCFMLGAPIGIWGLIILLKPEVKAAFRA